MRLAILDADTERAAFVRDTLFAVGHTCHPFHDTAALVHDFRWESFDLLILGWNPHDLTGEMMLRWVRGHHMACDLPVLAIGEQVIDSADPLVDPDAYVTWPVPAALLVAQVGAVFRSAYGISPGALREVHGNFSFDLKSDQVWLDETLLDLARAEVKVMLHLCRHLGRPVSRAHLTEVAMIRSIQQGSRTLDVYISKVRVKLAQCPGSAYQLKAVYGYGYRLDRIARISLGASVVTADSWAHPR
jgi:DNA-binding response OmpR family regulator